MNNIIKEGWTIKRANKVTLVFRTIASILCIYLITYGSANADVGVTNLFQSVLPHEEIIAVHKPLLIYTFNYIYDEFVFSRQQINKYTDSGQISTYIIQRAGTIDWENVVKREYEYDSYNRLIDETHYAWRYEDWRINWKNEYEYNSDGRLLKKFEYGWSILEHSLGEGGLGQVIEYSYDDLGRIYFTFLRIQERFILYNIVTNPMP